MPTIYRSMLNEGGQPQVGAEANMLGARIEGATQDIPVSHNGMVQPNTGGMSVSPTWREMPYFLVPKRLIDKFPAARGKNSLSIWKMGEGPFQAGSVAAGLTLQPDSPTHGNVEPDQTMPVNDYQQHLANTCQSWVIDEN